MIADRREANSEYATRHVSKIIVVESSLFVHYLGKR